MEVEDQCSWSHLSPEALRDLQRDPSRKRKRMDSQICLNRNTNCLDTGILCSKTGIKCLECRVPITPRWEQEDNSSMDPTTQSRHPHCQRIEQLLKMIENPDSYNCECPRSCTKQECGLPCYPQRKPHEPMEARVEIGDKPQIIARKFWCYTGSLGSILITRASTDHSANSITTTYMLGAAKTCSDQHSCSVYNTFKNKCKQPFCEFMISTLEEGQEENSIEQMSIKWAEKEHSDTQEPHQQEANI